MQDIFPDVSHHRLKMKGEVAEGSLLFCPVSRQVVKGLGFPPGPLLIQSFTRPCWGQNTEGQELPPSLAFIENSGENENKLSYGHNIICKQYRYECMRIYGIFLPQL